MTAIPNEHIAIKVFSDEDTFLNALRFTFYFEVIKKTPLSLGNYSIILLPKEKIELISIRFHSIADLQFFMEEHDFLYIDHQEIYTNDYDGQALFLFSK